jgi:hypothetical protein
VHLVLNGVTLSREKDINGKAFNAAAMATAEAAKISLSGGVWNGSAWAGVVVGQHQLVRQGLGRIVLGPVVLGRQGLGRCQLVLTGSGWCGRPAAAPSGHPPTTPVRDGEKVCRAAGRNHDNHTQGTQLDLTPARPAGLAPHARPAKSVTAARMHHCRRA